MEEMLTERAYAQYFQARRGGGRGKLARGIDYVSLRLILFAGAYLYFAAQFSNKAMALLLAAVFLGLCMLVLHIWREIAMERFVKKELCRIKKALLTHKLLLLSSTSARKLCRPLCNEGEMPVLLQRALPADADALLTVLHTYQGCGNLAVFSCSGFDISAKAFAARLDGTLTIRDVEEVHHAAKEAGLSPSAAEVRAFIAEELRIQKQRKRAARPMPFVSGNTGKYFAISLILTGISFFTRYALYYRLLAGLCMAIAATGIAFSRVHQERTF
ncbi:MAG: hypothetical protein RRZ24_05445 [Clostridia bacterium]